MTAHKVTTGPLKVLSAISILALALLVGLAFDLLVRDYATGAGFVIAGMLCCVAPPLVRRPLRPETWALLAASATLVGWVLIRDADDLVALNIWGALLLLSAAISAEVYDRRIQHWRISEFLGSWLDQLLAACSGAVRPLAGLLRERDRVRAGAAIPYLRGVAIAVPVFAVFLALLAAGDMVFSDFLDGLMPSLDFSLGRTSEHLAFVAFCGWITAGLLTFVLQPARVASPAGGQKDAPAVNEPARFRGFRIGYVEAMIVLGSVATLLALFVGFQFVYLFRGAAQIDLPGVTYAEYAREGFFQLIWVGVLVAGLIWIALRAVADEPPGARRTAFRVICLLMIALTVVILVSALKRLGLYEDAYGMTRMRLKAHLFIYLVGSVLTLLVLQVYRPRRDVFVVGTIALAFVALFSLNAINPDAYIAGHNLDRAVEARQRGESGSAARLAGELRYLSELSADAVPPLARRIEDGELALKRTGEMRESLGSWVCWRLDLPDGWRSWTLSRERARRAAAKLEFYDEAECRAYG